MSPRNSPPDVERRRLIDAQAMGVHDLVMESGSSVPQWITRLSVPTGWRTGHLEEADIEPCRIAVCGQRLDGGWDACETLSVFTFTGAPAADHLEQHCRRALAQLGVAALETVSLAVSSRTGVHGVRCSGRCTIAEREVWIQFTFYSAGSMASEEGCLVQQCIFVDANRLVALEDDVERLSDTLQVAFARAVVRDSL